MILINADSETGGVPNALLVFKSGKHSGDYDEEMNADNYEKWLEMNLIPNLPPRSVLVIDNAPYHNKKVTNSAKFHF